MIDEGCDDSDLELGIALSLSHPQGSDAERPPLPIVRRRLLPPVTVNARSKKLLRNVYRDNRSQKKKIDALMEATFRTLQAVGGAEGEPGDTIDVETLELALARLGYPLTGEKLQEMLQCYIGESRPASTHLEDYALYTRETLGDRNLVSEWRPSGAIAPRPVDRVDINTIREIFLDCNLRIENNGLIY
ncbi:uncharacterized protein BXIN_2030 [Babesia sp. Xinjiang]|uniref:uncharacterized protein n=1 Tax=Babesia sp. Xinjiang TaxID=462227 RepID=UPI000A25B079|nr:uncharacterized protein BXIN_2030 [Babesia sp. Xinjiang]ORM40330.1 hypothetical protein BXIN_2030 [Babesia sp. Xinjiang]